MVATLFFLVFANNITILSIYTISTKNPIYSLFGLILVFFNAAALCLCMHVEFFALIYLLIYIGAIAVLFLFVIMMLHLQIVWTTKTLHYQLLSIRSLLILLLLCEVILIYYQKNLEFFVKNPDLEFFVKNPDSSNVYVDWLNTFKNTSVSKTGSYYNKNSEIWQIGYTLYNYAGFCFIIGGLILFVAMIAAIALTFQINENTRRQNVSDQLSQNLPNTVFKISDMT